MITENPLFFVHVPKTAGSSIVSALKSRLKFNFPEGYSGHGPAHYPLFIFEKYNDLSTKFVFSVVRNPFTRAFSYYDHYLRVTGSTATFEQFLDHVRRKRQSILDYYDSKNMVSTKTPFIVYSQSFYIFNSKGKMGLDKLYRHENLSELENDFEIKLPNINVGSYSREVYEKSYDRTAIDLVRHIYLEDFVNLNYSMDFV